MEQQNASYQDHRREGKRDSWTSGKHGSSGVHGQFRKRRRSTSSEGVRDEHRNKDNTSYGKSNDHSTGEPTTNLERHSSHPPSETYSSNSVDSSTNNSSAPNQGENSKKKKNRRRTKKGQKFMKDGNPQDQKDKKPDERKKTGNWNANKSKKRGKKKSKVVGIDLLRFRPAPPKHTLSDMVEEKSNTYDVPVIRDPNGEIINDFGSMDKAMWFLNKSNLNMLHGWDINRDSSAVTAQDSTGENAMEISSDRKDESISSPPSSNTNEEGEVEKKLKHSRQPSEMMARLTNMVESVDPEVSIPLLLNIVADMEDELIKLKQDSSTKQ